MLIKLEGWAKGNKGFLAEKAKSKALREEKLKDQCSHREEWCLWKMAKVGRGQKWKAMSIVLISTKSRTLKHELDTCLLLRIFFFPHTCHIWKFLGQGSNLHHSCHLWHKGMSKELLSFKRCDSNVAVILGKDFDFLEICICFKTIQGREEKQAGQGWNKIDHVLMVEIGWWVYQDYLTLLLHMIKISNNLKEDVGF